jgi:hypothetical protein
VYNKKYADYFELFIDCMAPACRQAGMACV